jgi:NAD(P) transhydrogenase subunit alpha
MSSITVRRHTPRGNFMYSDCTKKNNCPQRRSAMQIGIPRESLPGETRVAATPETVKKYVKAGHTVLVEHGAGDAARYPDPAYAEAGAELGDAARTLSCELVLKVRPPNAGELGRMASGAALVGMLDPFNREGLDALAAAGVSAFALEAAPRITRAQSLDVLSSQANLAGYKAVLLAANHYQRLLPMMMTAAGTLKAGRVVILGAGVAGLQAIATARRLGAMVEASDVRPAAKEQIESLGAKFIDVPFETDEEREIAQGVGGYARPMPAAWMARQATLVAERCRQADIVISTALIPGRPAPVLITEDTVQGMKPGSVIVDLAVERGGNCPLSEKDKVVEKHGVTLVGYSNLPALVPTDASALYARNVQDFLKLIISPEGGLAIPQDDEIVTACLVCAGGKVLRSA